MSRFSAPVKPPELPASTPGESLVTQIRRRPISSYPVFQIPLLGLITCLTLWISSGFWGGGQLSAVAIALDLSGSTYSEQPERFNQPGTISYQQIAAVRSYLQYNERLKAQAQSIQILGFGGEVAPLTEGFQTDRETLEEQLDRTLESPDLTSRILPNTTLLDRVLQVGTESLVRVENRRRELLIVTDGRGDISQFYLDRAIANRVRINAIVVGGESRSLERAVRETGGTYRSGNVAQLEDFFRMSFFDSLFGRKAWQFIGTVGSLISLAWLLVLPLDRWIFQDRMNLAMDISGQLSLWFAYGSTAVILVWFSRYFIMAISSLMASQS